MTGAERWALVDGLEEAFARVTDGEGSEAHLLVGESGQGKTRVLQEFYGRLSHDQAEPAFWPREMVPFDAANPRKVVGPLVRDVSKGALPEWLWLPLSCR